MRTIRVLFLIMTAAGMSMLTACGDDGGGSGGDAGTDTDTDTDTDSDTDTDPGDASVDDGGPDASEESCAQAASSRGNAGCEFWPVDLDNAVEILDLEGGMGCLGSDFAVTLTLPVCYVDDGTLGELVFGLCDADGSCPTSNPGVGVTGITCQEKSVCAIDGQHRPFGILVTNPSASSTANVTLTDATGDLADVAVPPGCAASILPQGSGFSDQSLDGTSVGTAYELTSDRPIVAAQFNPMSNVDVFSNDASLLLPASTFDTTYLGLAYETLARRPSSHDLHGYLAVVATAPGSTTVYVTPTVDVIAGSSLSAVSAGVPTEFSLSQFDVLNLEAADGGDLTGSLITASNPVAVYAGHEATTLSYDAPSPCCADHLEEQLPPVGTWGWSIPVAYAPSRKIDSVAVAAPDLVRVTAQNAGTVISANPAPGGACPTLGAGQFCDLWITGDTLVVSDEAHPVLVAHYLASVITSGATDTSESGDPAMAFVAPVEQFRDGYTFATPDSYVFNYVSIVAPAAAGEVSLDGVDVTDELVPFADGTYGAVRKALGAGQGQHQVVCTDGCAVELYGWSDAVSYMTAGGLGLAPL